MPQRYFVDEINHTITGQDAHHIKHVMRMKTGDHIIVCADANCFLALLNINEDFVTYEVIHPIEASTDQKITLFQGLPKGSKTEFVAKYGTMFGASDIYFVRMKRSIPKIENEAHKVKRLSSIAKEAAELAHRFDVPSIAFLESIESIDFKKFTHVIVADENEKTIHLSDVDFSKYESSNIAIIIGPEGGIDQAERHFLQSQDAVFVSLGKRILSTESACLYVLSYISSQF